MLKESREAASLSLNELAKRAGLNRMAITFIERGERVPTLDTVARIAAALSIPPSELLAKAEEKVESIDWPALGKLIEARGKGAT